MPRHVMGRPSRDSLLAAALSLGFGSFVARLPLWVSSDTVGYVAMARSLREFGRLDLWDGSPGVWWPPGYAALLGLGHPPLGQTPGWLPLLNGLLAALLALTAWRITRHLARVPRTLLLAGLLLSASTLSVLRAYLSDGLFLCMWLGLCLALRRDRMPAWGLLLAATLPLVRTLGVVAWPAVAVHLGGRASRWRTGLVVGTLPLPFAVWCLRNFLVSGELLPSYPGQPRPFPATLRRSFEVLAESWVPRVDSTDVLLVSFVLLAIGLLAFAGGRRPTRRPTIALLALPSAFLVAFLYGSATRLVDRPDPRLLAPLYASTWVLVVLAVEGRWQARGHRARALLGFALAATVLASARSGLREARDRIPAEDVERRSLVALDPLAREIAEQVRSIDDSDPLVTNVPARVYWLTGRAATWEGLLADRDDCAAPPSLLYLREEFVRPFLVDAAAFAEHPVLAGQRYVETAPNVFEISEDFDLSEPSDRKPDRPPR